jgi:PAS domain S-box-containing protein
MMEMYPGIDNTELFIVMRDCMINRVAHQMENNFTYPDGTNRSLVENSESAIVVLDHDGQILYANSWAIKVWNDPKIVGKTIYQIYPEEYAKAYLKAIRKVIHAQTTIIDELESLIKDRVMWFRISLTPLRNSAGIVDKVLLNAWDIYVI